MLRLWAIGGTFIKDGNYMSFSSYIFANDKIEGEVGARRNLAEKYEVTGFPTFIMTEIPIDQVVLEAGIVDMSFKEKIDWAERDIVKGITEGKPLRESISMVLCAVSEDAYNRGRSYERDRV